MGAIIQFDKTEEEDCDILGLAKSYPVVEDIFKDHFPDSLDSIGIQTYNPSSINLYCITYPNN